MVKKRLYLCHSQSRYGENTYIPLSVGVLWAYARTCKEVVDAYEFCGFLYLKEPIEKAITRLENPQLLGLAHYIWNAEWNRAFARAVKERWPECQIIVGGVQVPDESARILNENQYFDFAVYGEGEGAFKDFLIEHARPPCDMGGLEEGPDYRMVGSLVWRGRGTVRVNARRPFVDLAELRSPYLDGVFDDLWGKEPRWQILHETGTRGCPYASFADDTIVALPDRLVRLGDEEYSGSSMLPCPDHGHRHMVGASDDRLVSQGKRKCIRLSFSNGLSLAVTPNHPMLVVREERLTDTAASSLKPGDWVPLEVGQNAVAEQVELRAPSKTEAERLADLGIGQGRRIPNAVVLPAAMTNDVAWLTGYLIGDGCLPSDNRSSVLFAVAHGEESELRRIVHEVFGVQLHLSQSSQTDHMDHGAIHSRKVAQFFRESVGVLPGEMKLRVPCPILRSPPGVVRSFLSGLWAADGHWPRASEPYLTTISERLANECAALIHWIGDAAVVRKLRSRSQLKNCKEWQYRVEWHGRRCRERVYGKPCLLSRVPVVRHTYRDRKGVLRLRTTAQDKKREGTPRAVLTRLDPDHPLLDQRFVFVRVRDIAIEGYRETFDVHHHPSHMVAANGVYVRQCSFCAWGQAALNEVRKIPDDRVAAEIEWFGQRRVNYVDGCDANFGLLKRDVDLTKALVKTKAKYGYPKTFRTSFAKNSNDVIWDIANILHGADMLKSVTLAMQSMDEPVLVNIKRKNIKFEKFGELLKRYEVAGIPTYTELILGLPGETLDTFIDGIDQNLEAGQHSGLFCYCLAEGTIVHLSDGRSVAIENVCPGESVLSWNEKIEAVEQSTAFRSVCSGTKSILEIEHENGYLRATANHAVLTTDGWKAVGELRNGDKILSCMRFTDERQAKETKVLLAGVQQSFAGKTAQQSCADDTRQPNEEGGGCGESNNSRACKIAGAPLPDMRCFTAWQTADSSILLSEMLGDISRRKKDVIGIWTQKQRRVLQAQNRSGGATRRRFLPDLWNIDGSTCINHEPILGKASEILFERLLGKVGGEGGIVENYDVSRSGVETYKTALERHGVGRSSIGKDINHKVTEQVRESSDLVYRTTQTTIPIRRERSFLAASARNETKQESGFRSQGEGSEKNNSSSRNILAQGPSSKRTGGSGLQTDGMEDFYSLGKRSIKCYDAEQTVRVCWSIVKNIRDVGTARVYDLINVKPNHNFFAGGVLVHNCNLMLENTEQKNPEYIKLHGLKTVVMQAMLTHGTPEPGVVCEKQEIVVETAAMPHADWKRAYLHMKVVEVFHAQGLLQDVAIALHDTHGVRYRDFYGAFLDWCFAYPETVAGREMCGIRDLLDQALGGGSWDCMDSRLGNISWPPEEFAFVRICCELEDFYDEVSDFLVVEFGHLPVSVCDLVDDQRCQIVRPEPGQEAEWAREVAWYNRKGYAAKKRKVQIVNS